MKSVRVLIASMLVILLGAGGGLSELFGAARADGTPRTARGVKLRDGGAAASSIPVTYDDKVLTVYCLTDPVPTDTKVAAGTDLIIAPKEATKVLASIKVNGEEMVTNTACYTYTVDRVDKKVELEAGLGPREGNAEVLLQFEEDKLRVFVNNVERKSGDKLYGGDFVLIVAKEKGANIKQFCLNSEFSVINVMGPSYTYTIPDDDKKLIITKAEVGEVPPAVVPVVINFDDKLLKVVAKDSRGENSPVKSGSSVDCPNVGDEITITLLDQNKKFAVLIVDGKAIENAEGASEGKATVSNKKEVNVFALVGVPLTLSAGLEGRYSIVKLTKMAPLGHMLVVVPQEEGKVFATLKVNGQEVKEAKGQALYEYKVPADAAKVEVEATFEDGPNKGKTPDLELKFDGSTIVLTANGRPKKPGEKVFAGDVLTITLIDLDKAYTSVKVNGKDEKVRRVSYYRFTAAANGEAKEVLIAVETSYWVWVMPEKKAKPEGGSIKVSLKQEDGKLKEFNLPFQFFPGDVVVVEGVPEEGYGLLSITVNGKLHKDNLEKGIEITIESGVDVKLGVAFLKKEKLGPNKPEPSAVESELLASAQLVANPVDDVLVVEGVEAAERVEVYGVTGELMHAQVLQGEPRVEVSARGWASGIYLVRILARDGERTLRVVKR